ncbi:MAG: carbohydrate binding domain-containing protein, partial [Paludibacter sp.]
VESFENGGWTFSTPDPAVGSAEIITTDSYSGTKCLKITITNAALAAPWNVWGNKQNFGSVIKGKKYKLKFWSKSNAETQKINFGFNLNGTTNELNSDYSSQQGGWIWTRNWEQHDITFTASQSADVALYFHAATNVGEVYIDDILLEEQPMAINDPGFEAQNWWIGGTPVNNTVTNNLGTLTYDNTIRRTGLWSLKVNTVSKGNAWDLMAVCGGVTFELGKEYKVSFWARGDADGNSRLLTVGASNGIGFFTIADAVLWKQYSFQFVCDATGVGAKDFGIQAGSSLGQFWVDDIEIVEIVTEPFLKYKYETNNLLPVNSGFEFGTEGGFTTITSSSAKATFETDNTDAFEGYKSLKVNVTTVTPNEFWNVQMNTRKFKVIREHNYILSFWAKADNDQKIDIKIADTENNTWIGGEKQFTLTNEWTRYNYEISSNITTSGQRGALLTFMLGRSTGNYWLDNIVFADLDTINTSVDLPILMNNEYSTQLKNGDFEVNGFENWTYSSDAALSTYDSKSGVNAVKISIETPSVLPYISYIKQSNISLAANKTYLVSFWAKANFLLYLKSVVSSNDLPLSDEYAAKLSKEWRRYEYFITPFFGWNINTTKANLLFGAAYQKGTYEIDDVIITNFEATADMPTTAIQSLSQSGVKWIVNNQQIQVFDLDIKNYKIFNLSGSLISSGLLIDGKAQLPNTIIKGVYVAKFTKADGAVVSNRLIIK